MPKRKPFPAGTVVVHKALGRPTYEAIVAEGRCHPTRGYIPAVAWRFAGRDTDRSWRRPPALGSNTSTVWIDDGKNLERHPDPDRVLAEYTAWRLLNG
jgi:hypothetical protein